jgi:hypothetical protein
VTVAVPLRIPMLTVETSAARLYWIGTIFWQFFGMAFHDAGIMMGILKGTVFLP